MKRSSKPPTPPTPEYCPVCGSDVPANALACPDCGADHRSGWREDADDGDSFNYQEFVEEEFGSPGKRQGLHPVWWVTAVLLLLAFAWFTLRTFVP